MNKLRMTIGVYILASALIWGAVMLGCSFKLKGTGCYDEISSLLSGAAGIHLIIIWGPLVSQLVMSKKRNPEDRS